MLSVDSYVKNNGSHVFYGRFDNDNPINRASHPCLMYEMQEELDEETLLKIDERIEIAKNILRRYRCSVMGKKNKKACVSKSKKSLCVPVDENDSE